MNKKANTILMIIFELLIVIAVVFSTSKVAYGYASSDKVLKINVAEDLAMMTNTLIGTHGDSKVEYPLDVEQFTFILSKGSITVLSAGDIAQTAEVRLFYLPKQYSATGTIENAKRVCLIKQGYLIELKNCQEVIPN